MLSVVSMFLSARKQYKTLGSQPRDLICFRVFRNPDETLVLIFVILFNFEYQSLELARRVFLLFCQICQFWTICLFYYNRQKIC